MNLGELEEFFIPKISRYKNLSHVLHRYQGLEDPLSPFQPIFLIEQNPVRVILLHSWLRIDGGEF